MLEDRLVLAQDSMLHRATSPAVRGTAVLRVRDFPGRAGDRPHVGFPCIAAAGCHGRPEPRDSRFGS